MRDSNTLSKKPINLFNSHVIEQIINKIKEQKLQLIFFAATFVKLTPYLLYMTFAKSLDKSLIVLIKTFVHHFGEIYLCLCQSTS